MAFPETAARKLVPGGFTAVVGGALSANLDGAGDFFSGLWQLVKAKATPRSWPVAYLATLFARGAGGEGGRLDEVFPPEMLRQWVHVAVTVVVMAVLGALVLRCCCAGGSRAARGGRRFMAAPGRGGARMPRGVFENNPRVYFRNLRAGTPLVY